MKVLLEPGHRDQREAQGHEGDRVSEGSVERSHGLMDKNRIEGTANQDERARIREVLVVKGRWCKSGSRVVTVIVLTRGDLALLLKGRRWVRSGARSQQRS